MKMKPADNAANMKNGNLGTDGTNEQYDKKHGHKGKALNPNNGKTLIITVPDHNRIFHTTRGFLQFKKDYLDKGFLKKIGAKLLTDDEINSSDVKFVNSKLERDDSDYVIKFDAKVQGGETEAIALLKKMFTDELSNKYGCCIWLDGKKLPVLSHPAFNTDPYDDDGYLAYGNDEL